MGVGRGAPDLFDHRGRGRFLVGSGRVWIAGADQYADVSFYQADLNRSLAIVIGSEGKGLRRLIRDKCDFLIRIPMVGKINSLNASVAAALIFSEARRQRSS